MSTKTLTTRPLAVTLNVTEDFLEGILVTAYEGGIGYWFRGLDHKQSEQGYSWIAGYDHEDAFTESGLPSGCGQIALDDWIEAGNGSEFVTVLDADVVMLGIERLLSGQASVNDSILGYILTDVLANAADPTDGGGMIDSSAADCIVQAGIFGEVVYG
jgi:hypothetical protein